MDTVLQRVEYVRPKLPAIFYWVGGGFLMFALQILNGASFEFSFLTALFTFLTGLTVQILGGVKTLFGLCTIVFAIQHVLFSQLVKLYLHQQPDARLEVPLVTMAVYCVGMGSMALGAYLSRFIRFARGASLFPMLTDPVFLRNLTITATIFAALRSGIITVFNYDQSTAGLTTSGVIGPLRVLGFLDTLAVASGTATVILASNGRRSMGTLNIIPLMIPILAGFIGAYRFGFNTAAAGYLMACWAYGFRFKLPNYIGMAALAYVFVYIISPYALGARHQVRTTDFTKNLQRSLYLLGDVIASPGKYQENTSASEELVPIEFKLKRYYTFASNPLERFAMIKNADAIIAATVYRGTMGWRTIMPGFEMLPPSWLYDDKPVLGTGNLLAHRSPGLVNNDDVVTQITIGPFADAFSSFAWVGAAVIPGLTLIMYVLFYGILVKMNFKANVMAVSLVPTLAVAFSEGTIATQIVVILQSAIVAIIGLGLPYYTVRLFDASHLRRARRRAAATGGDVLA